MQIHFTWQIDYSCMQKDHGNAKPTRQDNTIDFILEFFTLSFRLPQTRNNIPARNPRILA